MKTQILKNYDAIGSHFLGIAGAFVTMSMSSTESLSTVQGYKFISQADPCHAEQMCSTIFSATICTSGSDRLWGKDDPEVDICDVPPYKLSN